MEIQRYSFGSIVINEIHYTHDIKIIGNQVVSDWWRKSGHRVEPDDISDILEAKPDTIVLGKGDPGQMTSTPGLADLLEKKNIRLIEKPTKDAVATFNQLHQEGKNVAAGFHLTC